ncbi:MAG: alpha/beta hydrolase [Ilumatobacteraceae bacterium]
MIHPHDLAAVHRDDLDLAAILLSRIERSEGSRELLVAELVAAVSIHIAATDAVIAPAVEAHLATGDQRSAALVTQNVDVATALTIIESTSGPEADVAIAALRGFVDSWSVESWGTADEIEPPLFGELRDVVGDNEMRALGLEYVRAKRHAPTRPHPNSNSAILRLVSVIDRVKDASSGRAILAATDGSGILDDEAQQVINALAELGRKRIELLDPEQARRQPATIDAVNRIVESRDEDILPVAIARVDDMTITTDAGDLAARVFDAHQHPSELKPMVLYVHGGTWVIGDIYAYDSSARGIAMLVDAVVVSVGYRLAPEHPFPAAHDDIAAALRWLQQHGESLGGDVSRIAVVGEGAGASMAFGATVAALRNGSRTPVAQVLINPITTTALTSPSCRDNADAKPLDTAMLRWSFGHLLADSALADGRLDLDTLDDALLAVMPPTMVITAERDPLHDQGVAFAQRLKSAGATAAIREYNGVAHDFFGTARVVAAAGDAHRATATLLESAFRIPQ